MIPENLSTLKIHKLTQAQYERELKEGRIDPNAIYLTPDDSDESYFTVNETGETITGLTDTGKTQTELVIPYKINGVEITSIGNVAFDHCTSLTSINIPNSVTSIEVGAFEGCTNLTIYCEQGSYAETYAKDNNIPVVYTDIDPSKYLTKDNTQTFTPTSDYQPATKKYVDDNKTPVVDNLTSTSATSALSANQGKVLNDSITKIENNTTLIKNSNGGFAAGTGAIAVDGVAIGSNAIQEEGGYDVGGVAIGSGASARMGVAIGTNATQSDIASTGGSLGLINGGAAIGKSAKALLGGAVGDKATSDNGGAVGEKATTTAGGAVGKEATSGNGGAVGKNATTDWGGAVGCDASAGYGGAVGSSASAARGGAVGYSAVAGYGFSGGNQAKCATVDDSVIDAIQLGSGTNSTERTLQVYDYQLMDANGNIPAERLANVPQIIVEDNLTSTSSANALSANQGKVLSDKISNMPIKYMEEGSTASTGISTNATVGTSAVIVGDLRSRSYGTVTSGAVATGDYSLALGTGATAIGIRSTSIGYLSTTNGGGSQSLGYNADTEGQYALALGYNAKANGRSSIAMLAGTASGEQAFALGQNALASGDYSLAISLRDGYGAGSDNPKRETSAEAAGAISIGRSNKVSCENALAIGGTYNTVSVGGNSAIVGGYLNTIENGGTGVIAGGACNTIISGGNDYGNAIIAGFYCSVSKDHSFAQGSHNDALRSQFKIGHYSKNGSEGGYQGTTGDAFIIGNGTNTQDEEGNYTARSNAFRVSYSGGVYGGAAYNSSGADYAEYFEWIDGNPDGEDRRGLFVTLDGEKIRLATDEDDYILGVVSSTPCVQGDNYSDDWQRKYLTDVFGARLTQTVHHEAVYEERETIDTETGKKTVKKVLVQEAYDSEEWIINPDYDPTQEYVSREDRKEWSPIGFMGKLVVIDDGTCKVNGYCKAGENGIATKTTDKSGYRVMERIDDTHIKILVR